MDIRAEPWVIGDVPARVIGIIIEDDVIGIPIPVADVPDIKGSDAEVVSAEPETARSAACDSPEAFASDGSGEAPVLPRVVEMEARISPAEIVPYPLAIGMDMRRRGMAFSIPERPLRFVVGRTTIGGRSAARYIAVADIAGAASPMFSLIATLGKGRQREEN